MTGDLAKEMADDAIADLVRLTGAQLASGADSPTNPYVFGMVWISMHFPNDELRRQRFLRATRATWIANNIERTPVYSGATMSVDDARYAMSYAADFWPSIAEATSLHAKYVKNLGKVKLGHPGDIAALVLTIPLAIQARSGRSVGPGASYALIDLMMRRAGLRGRTRRSLEVIWKDYRDVSPFWAALRTFKDPNLFAMDDASILRFFGLAHSIGAAGKLHRLPRRTATLVDGRLEFRAAPGAPKIDFDAVPLPPDWEDVLADK